MDANEKILNTFTTRVRQMILHFDNLRKEILNLQSEIDQRDNRIKDLQIKLAQIQRDYENLKMAKMIEVSDSDLDGAKKKVATLLRDVNKCITLLSEQTM
jgi:archaellum component FlaC